jgi:hypothetical protein
MNYMELFIGFMIGVLFGSKATANRIYKDFKENYIVEEYVKNKSTDNDTDRVPYDQEMEESFEQIVQQMGGRSADHPTYRKFKKEK